VNYKKNPNAQSSPNLWVCVANRVMSDIRGNNTAYVTDGRTLYKRAAKAATTRVAIAVGVLVEASLAEVVVEV